MFKKKEKKMMFFGKDAKNQLLEEVEPMYQSVSCTLGAGGRNVAIKLGFNPVFITKDGVTVSKSLNDPSDKSVGAEALRMASQKTNAEAGDGTTSTTILGYELLKEGVKLINKKSNPVKIKKGLDLALVDITKEIDAMSKDGDIYDAAMVSSNGDEEISNLVKEAFNYVGVNGIVTIEEGKTHQSSVEVESGITLDKGMMSQHYAINSTGVEYNNPLLLIIDDKIDKHDKFIYFLKYAFASSTQRPLVIISNQLTNPVQNFLVSNKVEYGVPIVAITSPSFGEKRTDLMHDLAAITGGKVISESLGNIVSMGISGANEETKVLSCGTVLGSCKKIVVTKDKTVIFPNEPVDTYTETLDSLSGWNSERIAILKGKMAKIILGGNSEIEQRERYMRLEDCINAVRSVMKEGVVMGAGMALYCIKKECYHYPVHLDKETRNGYNLLYKVIDSIAYKIIDNAGLSKDVVDSAYEMGCLYNVSSNKLESLDDTIIVDASIAVKSSIKNAVSTVGTLLTTECLIYKD